MFTCPVARVVWGIIAICFQQPTRPRSYSQYWPWIKQALPGGENVALFGFAAVCWAIWKAQNRACFDKKKLIKNPSEIIYSTCMFMKYWADLYADNEGLDSCWRGLHD
jgi:hypothetical protein